MCRSTKDGKRRCPSCSSDSSVARANGNRRASRQARRRVVELLRSRGLVATAAALQDSPPSVLAEFMAALRIPASVLGDAPMPSTHSGPPSAAALVASARAELSALKESSDERRMS